MNGPGSILRHVWGTGGGRPAGLREDPIARELHLQVMAHGMQLAELACSPLDLEELILGFLFANAFVDGPGEVTGLSVETHRISAGATSAVAQITLTDPQRVSDVSAELPALRFLASGCGAPPPLRAGGGEGSGGQLTSHGLPAVRITPAEIAEMARDLQRCSPLFRSTGGVHAAALAGPLAVGTGGAAESGIAPDLIIVREDIGRHNAVDKVVGWALRSEVDLGDKALLVTGRLSAEIVMKAARAGIQIVLSRSAPTDLAVEAADAAEITLIGFARGDRANVYSNWWRVRE